MATPGTDVLLQKTDDELRYLVQHPELYHSSLVETALGELRRRGVSLPPATPPAPTHAHYTHHDQDDETPSGVGRWLPAAAIVLALSGAGYWLLAPKKPAATATKAVVAPKPIVLESVQATPLPAFEAEAAVQVRKMRQLLPAADRADTTAAGRYSRMARRYWLAENAGAHLTKQALDNKASTVFAGQVTIALDRISWFMKAKAYNQSLTPTMEARLTTMQQGLVIRRALLENLKSQYEMMGKFEFNRDLNRAELEASDISNEMLGLPTKRAPIQGNITEL